MNPITLFIFRILLIAGGFILIYIIGMPMVETIQYRIKGIAVEGKVIGFRGSSKTSKTIFDDNIARIGKSIVQEGLYIGILLHQEVWTHWKVLQDLL